MEMLVRTVDKNQPDPELSLMSSKRGDVIAICPDGWTWSIPERTNPEWCIIRSSILPSHASVLMATPNFIDPGHKKVRRLYKLDLDRLNMGMWKDLKKGVQVDTAIDIPAHIIQLATVKK